MDKITHQQATPTVDVVETEFNDLNEQVVRDALNRCHFVCSDRV